MEELLDDLVEQALARPLQPGVPGPLVTLDFDHTLIWGDIEDAVVVQLVTEQRFGFDPLQPNVVFPSEAVKLIQDSRLQLPDEALARTRRQLLWWVEQRIRGLCREAGKPVCVAWQAGLNQGLGRQEVHQLTQRAIDAALKRPMCETRFDPEGLPGEALSRLTALRPRPAMAALVARLQGAGFDVWVVSGSPQWVVEAAAERLYGIPADHALGTRLEEQGGRLTRTVVPPITIGQGKVDAIQKYVGRKPVLAMGDSLVDVEMLTYADHAVLLDKGDQELRQRLQEAGVLIQPRFPGEAPLGPCP